MNQSLVIVLPADEAWQGELRAKLEEYRGRLELKRANPYLAPEAQTSTACKVRVLERLLRDGKVATWDLSRELHAEFGGLDPHAFTNACQVIKEYCEEAGRGRLQRRR